MNAKFFASVSVLALTMCALGGVLLMSDDSDAGGTGSSNDPFDTLTSPLGTLMGQTIYIYEGSSVTLVMIGGVGAVSVTDGFGLSVQSSGAVTGAITKAGTIIISLSNDQSITLISVAHESDIDFTSPAAVSGISGGSISYTATTNIPASFSESGGSAASWLSVNSSTGVVSGTFPSVSSSSLYTYAIRAVSDTNSSNFSTQTISINVYPVAKISATSTSISGTEGESISLVSLSGNIGMTFSRSSGSFPEGISMSSTGAISGTPLESGSFSVVIRGTSTEGPSQTSTITITFDISAAEADLSVSLADPESSYLVGDYVSLGISCNVPGSTFSISGTAADWMDVSGSDVVGSVPSSYIDVTDVTLTLTAQSPRGQTASDTISFSVEPRLAFTSVPTADCIITPVLSSASSVEPLLLEVDAADGALSFPDTLTIQATFTGENAETVTWYWGDGSSDVGNKVQHTYSESGTYEILLVASNPLGDSEMTVTVTVGESPFSLLYIGIIVVLLIVAFYLVYRIVKGDGRRGRRRIFFAGTILRIFS